VADVGKDPAAVMTLVWAGKALPQTYWLIELATDENTLLAFDPINRMVPTTITRMTASMTAYSAMS
jgi:hypothetical protein